MNTDSKKKIPCKSDSGFKNCTVCKLKKDNLRVAPYFVCAYFSLETNRVKRICNKCYSEAENHQTVLVNMLAEHKMIISGPTKKPRNQVEIIDLDDDDDDEDEGNDSPEEIEKVQVEDDVDSVVKCVMEKYRFGEQLNAATLDLKEKLIFVQEGIEKIEVSHSEITKQINDLRKELYEPYEPILCHVDSVDIDNEGKESKHSTTLISSQAVFLPLLSNSVKTIYKLPPVGEFVHNPIQLHQTVYAMKDNLLKPWVKGCCVKIRENSEMPYDVCFENSADKTPRKFPLKYLAYAEPSPVQFPLGARVIAQYVGDENENFEPLAHYAGIICEEAKFLNQERYLVFFDEGYAQYCRHEQIMMVCHSSKDVTHDVHSRSRNFLSSYLNSYPERTMVKLQRGQKIKTELNGFWCNGRVHAVDASMARIYFTSDKRYEWIYRGSTRFSHLHELMMNEEARKKQGYKRPTRPIHNMAVVHKKKNAPYVEYTGGNVVEIPSAPIVVESPPKSQSSEDGLRCVARKSTASRGFKLPSAIPASKPHKHSSGIDACKTLRNESFKRVYFKPHQCGSECIKELPYVDGDNKNDGTFSIPMRWGWARETGRQRKKEKERSTRDDLVVIYRAPCGRRIRNMDELHRYLRITKSELGVDLFCFDSRFDCFREFKPKIIYNRIEDISYGVENVRVSCVNSIDRSYPEHIHYCTERIPRDGVNINLDPNFLVCCDCTDDCQNKEKCRCWQLTITGAARPGKKIDANIGYEYRRLSKCFNTAIYECNSKCSCRKTCINRVVQRPLQLRLQLFRTEKCGWGIRCLDDIPVGQFICIYVGELLTDHDANQSGKLYGDEYLADLNFIESTENIKDGYESECNASFFSSLESESSSGDDWGASEDVHAKKNSRSKREPKRLRTEKIKKTSQSLKAVKSIEVDDDNDKKKGTRDFYGPNEGCIVIDARTFGNIGRYFNHSCEPNIFAQSVFVDTHDLRFHWTALFASVFIRAGTELNWDYCYDVNSIPGRRIDCHCGSTKCRGRLL